MDISPEQCRAARVFLGLSQHELARRAEVARGTLVDFESSKRKPLANNRTAIRLALEKAGIEFTEDGGLRPRATGLLESAP
jgi:transcriptional regulator with XRE-family HTH domain